MKQDKIIRARMWTAVFVSIAAIVALFVFAGLYADEKMKTHDAYVSQYEYNLRQAYEEIDKFLDKKTDYDIHYNMILSDLGAARTMVFLIDDYADYQKIINELHFCFVKYPQQMKDKLEEVSAALKDITQHLDKGYDEVKAVVDSIDKMGN